MNLISLNLFFIFLYIHKTNTLSDNHIKSWKKGLGHKFLNIITALSGIVLFFTHIHDSIILWEIPYIKQKMAKKINILIVVFSNFGHKMHPPPRSTAETKEDVFC